MDRWVGPVRSGRNGDPESDVLRCDVYFYL